MIRKMFLCVTVLFLFTNINLFAQDEKDSTESKWYNWGDHEWFHWEFHGKPFIELNYGFGTPKQSKLVSKYADVGVAELKLGYASRDSYYEESIIQFHDKFAFASKLSADLKSSTATLGEMKSDLWRFGFANRTGYGYKMKDVSILLYHGEGFVWSKLDMKDYPAQFYYALNPPMSIDDAIHDTDILNRFHDAFRFGTVNEGGVKFEVASFVSLDAGYEMSVIFPRHLFWKHLGSYIIEKGADGLLNHFIDEVADSSPYAGPIVDFVLRNGLSYAFFALKKDNMNWPFATEAPLTYETFKFGITFTF